MDPTFSAYVLLKVPGEDITQLHWSLLSFQNVNFQSYPVQNCQLTGRTAKIHTHITPSQLVSRSNNHLLNHKWSRRLVGGDQTTQGASKTFSTKKCTFSCFERITHIMYEVLSCTADFMTNTGCCSSALSKCHRSHENLPAFVWIDARSHSFGVTEGREECEAERQLLSDNCWEWWVQTKPLVLRVSYSFCNFLLLHGWRNGESQNSRHQTWTEIVWDGEKKNNTE